MRSQSCRAKPMSCVTSTMVVPSSASARSRARTPAVRAGFEGAGRLVEQQGLGLHRQRTRDGDALLLAPGHLVRVGALAMADADPVEERAPALPRRLGGHLLHVDRRLDHVAERGAVGEEVVLLEHEPEPAADGVQRAPVGGAEDVSERAHLAGVERFEAVDAA